MGKLTVKETEELQEAGILKESTVNRMREKGLVSIRRNNKRYLKTTEGTLVSPQLYFQGIGKSSYSKKMLELKDEFNSLVGKYAIKSTNK
tara:strand:- start:16779 stop:17048 length:270 start_codon:yes stop_codon:yes gene_type:complete